jgi:hypothetical protein
LVERRDVLRKLLLGRHKGKSENENKNHLVSTGFGKRKGLWIVLIGDLCIPTVEGPWANAYL